MIAAVMVLQTLQGLSDREAADAVTFDLRWKAACGVAVDAGSFHPSTLTYWRRRLAASGRPHRIFEVVRQLIVETGAVQGRNRRALDSTVLDDAVARQDTVTQLIAAIRRVAREVPGAAEIVATRCTGHDYAQPGKPRIAWDDEAAREELVSALVNDALALLAALDVEAITAAGGKPAEAVALLALVAGQDVEPADGSDGTDGRWRIARRTAPDRMISTVDPEARHAHKTRERRQDGFKAHVVVEPDTGLTTACGDQGQRASRTATPRSVLPCWTPTRPCPTRPVKVPPVSRFREGRRRPTTPSQGRGTRRFRLRHRRNAGRLEKAGRKATIKPWPIRPAVRGRVHHRRLRLRRRGRHADLPQRGDPHADPQAERGLRRRLPGLPAAGQVHHLGVGPHRARPPAREAAAPPPTTRPGSGLPAHLPAKRPLVERSIAWLTRGNRRVPYRGIAKNNAWLHHRVAALNLRRLLALGLIIENGAGRSAEPRPPTLDGEPEPTHDHV